MMKVFYIVTLCLVLTFQLNASSNVLTVAETKIINSFSLKVGSTMIAADACLTELKVNKKEGLDCLFYKTKKMTLTGAYWPVQKIERKKRFKAVANNNFWYKSFSEYDKMLVIVKKINKHLLSSSLVK